MMDGPARVGTLPGQLPEMPDVVVLDPPRAGCRPEALGRLLELAPPRVAYVSCDAETLARDLKLLCEAVYHLKQVVPLDMFPQTHHVECVAFLERISTSEPVVLASASPRRRELLSELGLAFQVIPADVVEEPDPGESPVSTVTRLSLAKAMAVAPQVNSGYIIAADSLVVLEGRALGKPANVTEARRMLRQLRGTRHQVTTGLTVLDAASGRRLTDSMTSYITLRDFTYEEIEESIASGTPLDKAGAYAVQDVALRPAESWEGCYSNIVGLPLCRVAEMLEELGCDLGDWRRISPPGDCGPGCPFQAGYPLQERRVP